MTALQPDYFERPLAEVDPEVAEAIGHELERQQRTLEMIASENFVPAGRARVPGQRADQQVRRGLPGQALLRRLRVRRRRSSSSRSTARRRCSAPSTPTSSRTRARRPTRPSTTRCCSRATRIMGLALPHGGHLSHGMKINVSGRLYDIVAVRGLARGPPDRHGRGRAARQGAPPEAAAGRLVGLPALARLPALPRDRRRGRRAADGRHGALRRPGRGGHAPEPGPVRRRRHHDRPQDARRPALRPDPLPRGVREEDQLRGLPGPAGRPARARRSRPRRSRSRSPPPSCSRSASSARWPAPRRVAEELLAPATASTC